MCDVLSLSNGQVCYNHGPNNGQYPVDTVASITCDYGYNLDGSHSRFCQPSGTWNHTASCRQGNSMRKLFYACISIKI